MVETEFVCMMMIDVVLLLYAFSFAVTVVDLGRGLPRSCLFRWCSIYHSFGLYFYISMIFG